MLMNSMRTGRKVNVRQKKVVINGRFLLQDITGVQRVEREVLVALDKIACEGLIEPPEVLIPRSGYLISMPDLEAITVKRVGILSGHLWEQLELPFFSKGSVLWSLGNTAPIMSMIFPKTTVLTMVHDLSYKYFPSAYSWKFRLLYSILIPQILRLSDVIVTVSNSEKESIIKHYPYLKAERKIYSAQNGGIPDNEAEKIVCASLPDFHGRDYGIYVGSLSKRKNAYGVIRSAISFLTSYPESKFIVIGGSSDVFDSIEVDIPEEIRARLEFWGQVNDPQAIYNAFKYAKFLLFPSFYEASPLPPVEAMTFGCPVISSDIPSLAERCGDAAIYCDPNSLDSISHAISLLMDSPQLWNDLSEKGRSQVSIYSWRRQTVSLLEYSGIDL